MTNNKYMYILCTSYLAKKYQYDSNKKFPEIDIIKILLLTCIFVMFAGCVFQQTIDIPYVCKLCSYSHRLFCSFIRMKQTSFYSDI